MSRLRKMDENALRIVNESYLWLLDRTGVTVFTCMSFMFVLRMSLELQFGEKDTALKISCGIITGIQIAVLMPIYHWQKNGMYETYNIAARFWHESVFRKITFVLSFPILFVDLLSSVHGTIESALWILCYCYLLSCQIRRREPPEKLVAATEGAR